MDGPEYGTGCGHSQEVLANEEGLKVLVISVPKGGQRPYRTNRGIYYVRTTFGCRQASREELLRLFQTTSMYYDEVPVLRAGIDDLDMAAFADFLERAYGRPLEDWGLPPENLLTKLSWERPMFCGTPPFIPS